MEASCDWVRFVIDCPMAADLWTRFRYDSGAAQLLAHVFAAQYPMTIPREDLVVVFDQWSILPGRPGIPVRRTLERMLSAIRPPEP